MFRFFTCIILFVFASQTATSQSPQYPYKLKCIDYGILPAAITAKLGSMLIDKQTRLTNLEIAAINRTQINSFDRSATYQFNSSLSRLSDVTVYSLIVSPLILALPEMKDRNWSNICTFGVMYLETIAVTEGLKGLTKALVSRKRPYLYNTSLSIDQRQDLTSDNEAFDSFFSGHTISAFSSAVFLSKTYTDIYGSNTLGKVIWGTSLTLAATTGWLRYSSGNHFPSDIIVGALAGSAIGYIIPEIHRINRKSDKVSAFVSPSNFYFSYRF